MKKKRLHIGVVILLIVCAIGFLVPHVCACVPYGQSSRMITAIRDHDMNTVKSMLEAGVSPNVPNGPYRGLWRYTNRFIENVPECPLSVACQEGNLEMVKLLLEYGATPAATEREGLDWSALSSAVLHSENEHSLEIVELLIENGANVESDKDGWPPVELACMEYISSEKTPDERAAHAERVVQIVKLIIGDYELNSNESVTLLMHAARCNNAPLVEYLLSIGADPNIRLSDGRTACDFAINAGHEEVAALLKAAIEASATE